MQSCLSPFVMPPLGSFLASIGRTVVIYDGFDWFTTTLSGMVAHAISGRENAFLHAPNGDRDAIAWIQRIGVRLTADRGGEDVICLYNNPEDNRQLGSILDDRLRTIPGVVQAERVLLVQRPDLPLPRQTVNLAYAHLGAVPTDLRTAIENGASRIITNDWRAALFARLASIPCCFFSGPRPPSWLEKVLRDTCVETRIIRDKRRACSCPCGVPSSCHDKQAQFKPCVSMLTAQEITECFRGRAA